METLKEEQELWLNELAKKNDSVLSDLEKNATEFLMLAMLTRFEYVNSKYLIEASEYFELSIKSFPSHGNLFSYGMFLSHNNQFSKAEECYRRCLDEFGNDLSPIEIVEILNNIAGAEIHRDKVGDAERTYERALALVREQVDTGVEDAEFTLAYILNNFGHFYRESQRAPQAKIYLDEAMAIRRRLLADENKVHPNLENLAVTLTNLALVCLDLENFVECKTLNLEALELCRKLPKSSKLFADRNIAMILNNLGQLYTFQKEYVNAEKSFAEALEIYERLYQFEPLVNVIHHTITLLNLAKLYAVEMPNRELSIDLCYKAILVGDLVAHDIPLAEHMVFSALRILEDWGINSEEALSNLDNFVSKKK